MNVVRGRYQIEAATGRTVIEDAQGVLHDVVIGNSPEPPVDRTIEALLDDGALIDWQPDLSDLPQYEVRKIDVLVGYGLVPEVELTDAHFKTAKSLAKQLENEARRVGRDRWEVNTYPVVHHTRHIGFFSHDWLAMGEAGQERYPGQTFTHASGISGNQGNPCGNAHIGGVRSWTRAWCAVLKKTHIHETLGHSIMGVEHAGNPHPGNPYGEGDTWQGDGRRDFADFNAPHLFHAGLIEENNVVRLGLGKSVRTHLVQGSDDPLSLKPGENKMVLCHIKDDGQGRRVAVAFYQGTVRVYEPGHPHREDWLRTGLVHVFRAAGTEVTHNGVFVRVHKLDQFSADVEVYNNTTDHQPISPYLPVWVRPERTAEPQIGDWCRGQWGNRRWSAQGMHVGFTDDGRLVLHWLTWNRREAGKHRWFWAVCQVDGTLAYGQLQTADKFGRPEDAGYVEVFWYDRDTGIARGESPFMGRFAVPMTRVSQAVAHPLAGYYGIGNGQGLTVSVDERGQALAYWLLHDQTQQVWRMLTGPLDAMTIYSVDGGQGCVKSDIEIAPIGTASIIGTAFEFEIGGEQDQRQLRRLA